MMTPSPADCACSPELAADVLGAPAHDAERRADLVRDAGRQHADGGQLLGAQQLILERAQLRQILDDQQELRLGEARLERHGVDAVALVGPEQRQRRARAGWRRRPPARASSMSARTRCSAAGAAWPQRAAPTAARAHRRRGRERRG